MFWKFITLLIAIMASALWVNIIITEGYNSRLNAYGTKADNEKSMLVSKVKNTLICIASLAWTTYIIFF